MKRFLLVLINLTLLVSCTDDDSKCGANERELELPDGTTTCIPMLNTNPFP